MGEHIPVLAEESLEALNIQRDGIYVDATFGRGGHSQMMLDALGEGAKLIAFDQDHEAIAYGKALFRDESRLNLIHSPFSRLHEEVEALGLVGKIDGVLMDVGVSSPQLDQADRGFSFMRDGPLDMRMNQQSGPTVYEWLMKVNEFDLALAIYEYGEERHSRRIARKIIEERKASRLKDSTAYLADLVCSCGVKRERNKHPATRTFQALRIAVNQEVEQLEKGLHAAARVLKVGGRLVVIGFHALEHRIVKSFIRQYKKEHDGICMKQIGKAMGVSLREEKQNPRSRSAYLRVIERVICHDRHK